MEIAITGSSGLIGSALTKQLTDNQHRVVRLVRRSPQKGKDEIEWQPAQGKLDAKSLEGIDAVVNVAGAGIGDKRWTDSYKALLVSSRTDSTTLLSETIAKLSKPPKRYLSASAIGFYGDRGSELLTEDSTRGTGFLSQLCLDWELSTKPATAAGIETALIRTGIVLTKNGGALKKMLPLFRFGVGGRFGNGKQYMSWISLDDHLAAMEHLLTSSTTGPVNLTAPTPVTNSEFTKALASTLKRPAFLPVPKFGPKLLLGSELAQTLLFDGQQVVPQKLEADGFSFKHTSVKDALEDILS